MGGRFAAQMGAPLTAQPIEIEALEVGNDRQKGSIERQRSARRWRRRSLPRLPGVGARGSCRLRRSCRLLLGPAGGDRVALPYGTISQVSRGVRDPVD